MSTSSNNYLTPFAYPPPNYNAGITWNYSTWAASSQNVSPRSVQNSRSLTPPPPPPPLPYPADNSHTNPPLPPVSPTRVDQRLQSYYNSNQPGLYHNRRYNGISAGQYSGTTRQYTVSTGQYPANLQYSTSPRQYNTAPTLGGHYVMNSPQGYTGQYYRKRKSESESDVLKKGNKKRKRPLSQNVPQRKDWSVNDAKRALLVEKEYNKRHRSQSLIIKFPDLELNRDIVSKFHSSIESVHFQQPSTPRFCFVTLNDSADPEIVINALNKTKFGKGYLTAEFKKDRDDEINIGPEDIDPLTLYVGNLAQEVTKDDMVSTYPKQKRIDIGYAKKMKYTRYAFVTFKNVDDSIEAFQKTHASQMYSKSIIVRFRRLNGTVGMPGEPKPQMPSQKNYPDEHHQTESNNAVDVNHRPQSDVEAEPCVNSSTAPWEMVDVSNWETDVDRSVDFIKQEPPEDSDEDDEEKPPRREYLSPFMPGSIEVAFSLHKPIMKANIKREKPEEDNSVSSSLGEGSNDVTPIPTRSYENNHSTSVDSKKKVVNDSQRKQKSDISKIDCLILPPDQIKKETEKTDDSGTTYNSLRYLNKKIRSLDTPRVEVKRETSTPTLDEASNDSRGRVSSVGTEDSARVKSEPDNGDETNGYEDSSSDESDDFNFNNILSSIEDRSRRLMKLKKAML